MGSKLSKRVEKQPTSSNSFTTGISPFDEPSNHPANPTMENFNLRLLTFDQRWLKEKIISPTSAQIAAAGFFFLKRGDLVKCWHCGGGLGSWQCDDDPWEEHAKWYPTCQFVMREKVVGFIFRLVNSILISHV